MSEKYHFIFQNVINVWSSVSFCPMAKHETWRVTNVTQKIQKTVCVQSYFRVNIYHYKLFNRAYSYFCATFWIYESEMRKVLLYHFAACTVSFCPGNGAKWYSWSHILNGLFQALMSFYVCIASSQVVAKTWQCIIHVKANKIYQVIKAGKKYFKKVDHFAPVSPTSCQTQLHRLSLYYYGFNIYFTSMLLYSFIL